MNPELRATVNESIEGEPRARLTRVLRWLEIPSSTWYRRLLSSDERKRPGPAPKAIPAEVAEAVVEMATTNPWYGYKRIAVMCRRSGARVKNREAYLVMKRHGLPEHPGAAEE